MLYKLKKIAKFMSFLDNYEVALKHFERLERIARKYDGETSYSVIDGIQYMANMYDAEVRVVHLYGVSGKGALLDFRIQPIPADSECHVWSENVPRNIDYLLDRLEKDTLNRDVFLMAKELAQRGKQKRWLTKRYVFEGDTEGNVYSIIFYPLRNGFPEIRIRGRGIDVTVESGDYKMTWKGTFPADLANVLINLTEPDNSIVSLSDSFAQNSGIN